MRPSHFTSVPSGPRPAVCAMFVFPPLTARARNGIRRGCCWCPARLCPARRRDSGYDTRRCKGTSRRAARVFGTPGSIGSNSPWRRGHVDFDSPFRGRCGKHQADTSRRTIPKHCRPYRRGRNETAENQRLQIHAYSTRSVLRYFIPESQMMAATVFPRQLVRSSSSAAATFAPDENPPKIPSSFASRRAVAIASSSLI